MWGSLTFFPTTWRLYIVLWLEILEFGNNLWMIFWIVNMFTWDMANDIYKKNSSGLYLQIKGDEDCFFNSILAQIKYKTENCAKRYGPIYLRRQLLLHYMKEMDLLENIMITGLKENHGMLVRQRKMTQDLSA